MQVRVAKIEDWDEILNCYEIARQYMKDTGNPTQWGDNHPPQDMLREDIKKGELLVCVDENDSVHGVFAFILGDDPTYEYIEDGQWLNDEPYGTMHRMASDGKAKGVFKDSLEYCKKQIANVRADTHHDNKTMQHLFEKYGFARTGIIYVDDGTARIAYHLVQDK